MEWSSAAGPDVLVAIAFLLTKHKHIHAHALARTCTHIHAHTRKYTHMHAHQHLVHFYFVLLVLLVFSTDIVFCALFWCCFHFCFVYFQRLFLGVATGAGHLALRSPSQACMSCMMDRGTETCRVEREAGRSWTYGQMDECSVDKVRIHLYSTFLSLSLLPPLSFSLSHGPLLCLLYSFFSSSSSVL